MRIENSLPREYQFNTSFDELDDILTDWAEFQMVKSVKLLGEPDIIDSHEELGVEFEKLYKLSEVMLHGALGDISETEEARGIGVFYRGLLFGVQLAAFIDNETKSFSIGNYFKGIESSTSVFEKFIDDTSEYLGERPALDAFLGRYMPEIDPTGMYNHLAEAGASFMLMLNERALAETYLQNTSQALTPDFFIEKEK